LANPVFTFAATPTSPTDVYVRAVDTDLVSSRVSSSVEGGVKVASGRIKIPNVYGSELLQLPVALTVQYYSGTYWLTSLTDNFTSFDSNLLAASGNVIVDNVGSLPPCNAEIVNPGAATVVAGQSTFNLATPGVRCSANISLNAPSYLPSSVGRITFGIYKSPLIYRRENY
jgi:MSHA biogenesis protein MshQ